MISKDALKIMEQQVKLVIDYSNLLHEQFNVMVGLQGEIDLLKLQLQVEELDVTK